MHSQFKRVNGLPLCEAPPALDPLRTRQPCFISLGDIYIINICYSQCENRWEQLHDPDKNRHAGGSRLRKVPSERPIQYYRVSKPEGLVVPLRGVRNGAAPHGKTGFIAAAIRLIMGRASRPHARLCACPLKNKGQEQHFTLNGHSRQGNASDKLVSVTPDRSGTANLRLASTGIVPPKTSLRIAELQSYLFELVDDRPPKDGP
jgi:hypothetical protein